ncbi:carbohydrate kinase family protein [Methanoplanus sp. FWC-SCC4]|uniref:Carbohydrate kinase family protein n=1 Tax=Methanochimaera problematica TaxID=2609417 RepID=A0AA97I2H9_9EURY|nr:carbohydrate kinase family protein [Methanoplanus sp. FWC-SCC4]WOF15628.1 carbohydrate kinase family protein [Methanoplanus sp. FWC-SCC4]
MISVVGHTAIDHIFTLPVLPKRHSSSPVLDHKVYFGGGAANIAAGIAVLGGEAELISAVGNDFFGSEYEKWMNKLGIKKDFFVVEDKNTPTCYLFNDTEGDQTTVFEWGASEIFKTAKAPSLDFVHMATAEPEFNVKIAEKAVFSSFDPGQDLIKYTKEQLISILDHIDILFTNIHELKGICDKTGIGREELIKQIPLSIVTMSGDGSEIHHNGNITKIPAISVKLADPTGAGDSYRAGFLTAYQKGYSVEKCCKIGTTTASFIVEMTGCQTNLPDWDRMKERYNKYFGDLYQ